jgi:hypothetical protein
MSTTRKLTNEEISQYTKLSDRERELLMSFAKCFPASTIEWFSSKRQGHQFRTESESECKAVDPNRAGSARLNGEHVSQLTACPKSASLEADLGRAFTNRKQTRPQRAANATTAISQRKFNYDNVNTNR